MTNKQRIFIDEYLKSLNATKAAIRAGYSEKTAYSIGQENLKKPDIKSEIDARMQASHMSADEALRLTSDIARGDIGDLLNDAGYLDILKAKELGLTRLLRKVKQKTTVRIGRDDEEDTEITEIEFEMYSAHEAQRDILKIGGRLNGDITINVNLTDD